MVAIYIFTLYRAISRDRLDLLPKGSASLTTLQIPYNLNTANSLYLTINRPGQFNSLCFTQT